MGHAIIILEQWQQTEGLAEKLLKDGKISRIDDIETVHSLHPREYYCYVEGDFDDSADRSMLATYRVVNNELVKCTRPLAVREFEEAQETIDTLKQKGFLLGRENNKLQNTKMNTARSIMEMHMKKKELKTDIDSLERKLAKLNPENVIAIENSVDNLSILLNEIELKGKGADVNKVFIVLGEITEILSC